MDDLVYSFPSGAFLVFAVALFVWLFWRLDRYRGSTLKKFSFEKQLPHLLTGFNRRMERKRAFLLCIVWGAASLALMGPKGNAHYLDSGEGDEELLQQELMEKNVAKEKVKSRRKHHEVVILLDVSASMSVKDTRQKRSRLAIAKEIADDFVSLLDGQSVSLYAFTSQATKIVPSTMDLVFLRMLLKDIEINEGDVTGTDFVEVLETIKQEQLRPGEKKQRTILLLTDGGDTRLEKAEGEAREGEINTILSRLGDPEALNLRLYTVGMGSSEGEAIPGMIFEGEQVISSLDEQFLKRLSSRGRGRYYFANHYSSLAIAENIAETLSLDESFIEEEKEENISRVKQLIEKQRSSELLYDHYFQLPLAIALFCLAFYFLLPLKVSKVEPLS